MNYSHHTQHGSVLCFQAIIKERRNYSIKAEEKFMRGEPLQEQDGSRNCLSRGKRQSEGDMVKISHVAWVPGFLSGQHDDRETEELTGVKDNL